MIMIIIIFTIIIVTIIINKSWACLCMFLIVFVNTVACVVDENAVV